MTKYKIVLQLHPSIPLSTRSLYAEVDKGEILKNVVISLLSKQEDVRNLLLKKGEISPGYLLISEKIELRTTKKIDEYIHKDMEIRIIPISHGG
ncbi:MAG: hypothetical protein ACTSSG_03880 [Candidatus Heimdallarchaeaceae archaeon]